jgi:hypothetical protein
VPASERPGQLQQTEGRSSASADPTWTELQWKAEDWVEEFAATLLAEEGVSRQNVICSTGSSNYKAMSCHGSFHISIVCAFPVTRSIRLAKSFAVHPDCATEDLVAILASPQRVLAFCNQKRIGRVRTLDSA